MDYENNPVCIIGARKGSKRLPKKNQLPINNIPLYLYTVQAALDSKIFKKVFFSTDDEVIIAGLKDHSEIILDVRPSEIATSNVSMMEVTNYIIQKYNQNFHGNRDIVIMTPCNPLRNSKHICEAYNLFKKNNANSLVSLTEFPFPVERSLEIKNNRIIKSWDGRIDTSRFNKRYYPNGAIVIINQNQLIKFQNFYLQDTIGYIMKWPYSIDIDYEDDYMMAKMLIENNLLADIV